MQRLGKVRIAWSLSILLESRLIKYLLITLSSLFNLLSLTFPVFRLDKIRGLHKDEMEYFISGTRNNTCHTLLLKIHTVSTYNKWEPKLAQFAKGPLMPQGWKGGMLGR